MPSNKRPNFIGIILDALKEAPPCDKPNCIPCSARKMYDEAAKSTDIQRMTEIQMGIEGFAGIDSIGNQLICYKDVAFEKAIALADSVGAKLEVKRLNLLWTTCKALRELEEQREMSQQGPGQ